ncbi:HIT domain-containing protein [Paenibacillus sp. FSL W7-1279]|uniref:HIT family protein n=1 Tax=Paenibacillus sp. FSL W7-1279 TaxID=2921697 RepID=UPI0030DB7127
MEDCIYCNITQEINHEVLLENDLCIYSLMQDQEIQGAGIIVPRSHKETVFDLSQEEWNATYQLLHEVKIYLDDKYKPDGYNVGWNCGQQEDNIYFILIYTSYQDFRMKHTQAKESGNFLRVI